MKFFSRRRGLLPMPSRFTDGTAQKWRSRNFSGVGFASYAAVASSRAWIGITCAPCRSISK